MDNQQQPSPGAFISARGLGLKSLGGYVYKDVNLDIARGEVAAICGNQGCGKTSLLLTLAGRMLPSEGQLRVKKYQSPKQRKEIAKISDLGIIDGLNEPDRNIKVFTIMRADLDLGGKPHSKEATMAALKQWTIDDVADKKVRDLTQQQHILFGVALASCSSPELIIVDDIENQLTHAQSLEIIEGIKVFAHETNTTVCIGVTEQSIAQAADSVYFLGRQ